MNNSKFNLGQVTQGQMVGLMLLAYLFSFAIRLIWVFQFQDNPSVYWNSEIMINTNDGYFFAAGAQEALTGIHADNPRVFGIWDYGLIFFTSLFAKITPFSLETIILYMPAVISSLVVIPMILIARRYKQTMWGFFAALLGSITWSYYNRTMTGYYDTDMFSAMAPMFILFFLIKSTIDLNLRSALYAGLAIVIYPFLYDQGQAIVYSIGIIYGAYMLWFHRDSNVTYSSLILVFISLLPLNHFIDKPYSYLVHFIILIALYLFLKQERLAKKEMMIATGVSLFLFLFLGDVFGLILGKVLSYTLQGTGEGSLHFYGVNQTVREAGKIPFETFANRTSGSSVGVIVALIGYVVLVFRRPAFILALPLIGIGIFSMWGGLRFTVYAVPIAAMSAIYLFFVIAEQIKDNSAKYAFIALATAGMIYPNITHIIGYKVPTVLNKTEVADLAKLDSVADGKDYTLTWWDYGYPIWFYSDTSTLIDGGKHNNDNFIISKILLTPSQDLAANLSRLAVETYEESNHSIVANKLFEKRDPNILLEDLESSDFKLPKKTRDVFLYLPYRMLRIFPTVAVFGNINLKTGKKKRTIHFYPSAPVQQSGAKIILQNGIIFDTAKGEITIGGKIKKVERFDVATLGAGGTPQVKSQLMHMDGEFCVVFLKSYGQMIVMDRETYNSTYVQMFMLGKYDKELFELVVSSPYSKIYKLKK
jgi:dolichyl-diphosphooligosaccharide--protein glycosyltransferase/undecaprenyl-diphosphooligosaccharide--protein glycosyltransferase